MSVDNGSMLTELLSRHRRLAILCVLTDLPGKTGNIPLLRDCIGRFGLATDIDILREEVRFLKQAGLISLDDEVSVWRICLLERGFEVTKGTRDYEGVLPAIEGRDYRVRS